MGVNNSTKIYLKSLASVLKVQLDKESLKEDHKVTSKVFRLLRQSQSDLGPKNASETAEIQQYIEYGFVYVLPSVSSPSRAAIVLNELNDLLMLKTFFVGNRVTVADLLLFYILCKVMESLTISDKEKFLNVCRWFDNIQQDSQFRQSNKLIDFSTNYLAGIVPARH